MEHLAALFLLLVAIPASAQNTQEAIGRVTLAAVGDIRLDGPFGRMAQIRGFSAPTKNIKKDLEADILFGNLECSVTDRGAPADKKFTFRAPPKNIEILRDAGFDIVSLGNNHIMDYGPTGLSDTFKALSDAQILHVGAGDNAAAAQKPVFIVRKGLRIGFMAVTSSLPKENWAGETTPGVAYSDIRHLADWVREAKKKCDVLVVSYHGGTELEQAVSDVQKAVVARILQGGADLILGHHPHVLQPVEQRGKSLILYSLGNFLFVSPTPGTEWTVVAHLTLSRSGVTAEFVPLEIRHNGLRPAGPYGREIISAALAPKGGLKWNPTSGRLRIADLGKLKIK